MPAIRPNPTAAGQAADGEAKLATTSPMPVSTAPMLAMIRGPSLSWSRPAGTIMIAKQAMAMVYGSVAWVRVQPNPPRATGSVSCFEKIDHA